MRSRDNREAAASAVIVFPEPVAMAEDAPAIGALPRPNRFALVSGMGPESSTSRMGIRNRRRRRVVGRPFHPAVLGSDALLRKCGSVGASLGACLEDFESNGFGKVEHADRRVLCGTSSGPEAGEERNQVGNDGRSRSRPHERSTASCSMFPLMPGAVRLLEPCAARTFAV